MSGAPKVCSSCGHASSPDARFCGRCGAPFAAEVPAAPAAPAAPARGAHATMIGASLDDLPGAPPSTASAPRTLIDAPLEPPPGLPPSPFASPPQSAQPAPRAAQNKTMLGVALQPPEGFAPPMQTQVDAPADTHRDMLAQPAPEPARAGKQNRTMLGMPAIDAAAIAATAQRASQPEVQPAPAAPAPVAASPAIPDAAPAPRVTPSPNAPAATVIGAFSPAAQAGQGAAPVQAAPAQPAAAQPETSKRSALGPSNRTMLGVVAPVAAVAAAQAAAAPAPAASAPAAPSSVDDAGDLSIAGLPSPAKRSRGLLVAMLGLGVVLMVCVVAGLAWWRFGPRPAAMRATVAQSEEGEALEVELPGAPEGSRVRFGGAEQPLVAGRARLPLSAEALHVGDNPLDIEVVAPGGAVESHRVTLTLELRVRADLTTLDAAEPAITVVVEALPGSSATLDGTALPLDAAGRGSRAFPIAGLAPSAEGVVQHDVRWTVQPPSGEAAEGTLTTRVPLTTIQIDRPGTEVVTDRDRVEIAGAVPPQATVTIDGAAVPVNEGRFLHTYPLAALGEARPSIVARAPGRAPVTRTITIRRVADLAREAASYDVDRSLTYARIAPSPAHFQGQRVALEGRVYNVDVQAGRSVLQMLVRDCPGGQRCPLWVTYPAATDVTVESWVRVLGTVAGEQQFRSESGQVRTVPRVDAVYVLPARP